MPWRMVAYDESLDQGDVLDNVAALADQHVFTSGDDIRVPADSPFLIGFGALTSAGGTNRAQLTTPSLRRVALLDIEPVVNALVWGSPPEMTMRPLNPVKLEVNEALNLLVRNDPAAGERQYGLVLLANGPIQPVTGEIFTVRGTLAISIVVTGWTNGAITFNQTLPVGRYQVVGMRARSTNMVAARLVFIGGTYRPGVPAVNAIGDLDNPYFRNGQLGVWGEFDSLTPPTVDALGVTDTTEVIELDLIKVG